MGYTIRHEDWHIIGNADRKLFLKENERIIRFNQPKKPSCKTDLYISNQHLNGKSKTFVLAGLEPFEGFKKALNKKALYLEDDLGTWPSTGLTALCTLHDFSMKLRISRMNLLPSIVRPKHMSSRKPLPCTYHNWLGERRVVFPLINNLNWTGFWLANENESTPIYEDPYPRLLELPVLNKEDGRSIIKLLKSLPKSSWLYYASEEKLKKSESLFFLNRDSQATPNWWLYNHKASCIMGNIHQSLSLAQQVLYCKPANVAW